MTYVISDIHGRYDLFLKMLEEINFTNEDTLWVLGDVVDRGSESIETLIHIINTDNIHMILGNHEEFMLDFFKRNQMPTNNYEIQQLSYYETWFSNGGKETIRNLFNYSGSVRKIIIDFIGDLPLIKQLKVGENMFYLAHADLQFCDNGEPFSAQSRDLVLWNRRRPSDNDRLKPNTYLITGHTVDRKIRKHHNWYCIDCGAPFYNSLGCLRLDDFKEFYVYVD